MARVDEFDATKLARRGFIVKERTADYFLLLEQESNNEVIVWKLGNWLQFRCMAYQTEARIGSALYVKLSETINRLHDVALGARVALSDSGEMTLISDILHSTINTDIIARTSRQLLFLADKMMVCLEGLSSGRASLSEAEIDELLSN